MVALKLSTEGYPTRSRSRARRGLKLSVDASATSFDGSSVEQTDAPPSAPARSGRPLMTLDAVPVDSWEHFRIERPLGLSVEQLSDLGLDATSAQCIAPGRRVAIGFPDSPFLPRPGTLAIVEKCTATDSGYHIKLAYEPVHAA